EDVRRQVRIKPGVGVAGLVASSMRSLLVRDAASAPIVTAGEGSYRSESFVSVPIVVDNEPRGVLNVTERIDGRPFDQADLETLELLAGHIGAVLVQQEQGEALQRLAETDPLTWLFNRRHFDRRLEAETNRALRAEHLLALLMLDVDRFKSYNDRYGHHVGDLVLKAVATAVVEAADMAMYRAKQSGGGIRVWEHSLGDGPRGAIRQRTMNLPPAPYLADPARLATAELQLLLPSVLASEWNALVVGRDG